MASVEVDECVYECGWYEYEWCVGMYEYGYVVNVYVSLTVYFKASGRVTKKIFLRKGKVLKKKCQKILFYSNFDHSNRLSEILL